MCEHVYGDRPERRVERRVEAAGPAAGDARRGRARRGRELDGERLDGGQRRRGRRRWAVVGAGAATEHHPLPGAARAQLRRRRGPAVELVVGRAERGLVLEQRQVSDFTPAVQSGARPNFFERQLAIYRDLRGEIVFVIRRVS